MIPWMKGLFASLALALLVAGCGAGDDTVEGTHAQCAFGGVITDCPDAEHTSQGICWRLVDCGAIVLQSNDQNRFTWGDCVDNVDSLTEDRQRVVIECIAASTCDELRVKNYCGLFGQ
jgi:hypothetical protein